MAMRAALAALFPKPPWKRKLPLLPLLRARPPETAAPVRYSYSEVLSSYQVIFAEHGCPQKVLSDKTISFRRTPPSDQILVKMLMAPANPSDLDIIAGTGYYTPEELPAVAGNEGVGVVVQTGSNVTTIHLGDWVIPKDVGWGTWRQWAFTTEKDVVKVPNNLPLLGAATLGCYPCTAYRMLKGILNLGPGDVVFQNSVYSNVGLAVIQLAKQWEITTVNVLRDGPNTDQQSKELREFGATHVITDKFLRSAEMQYFVEALPSKPRLAFNCAGWVLHEDIKEHLHDVIMVTYGDMSRKHVTAPEGETIEQLEGYWQSTWTLGDAPPMEHIVKEISKLILEGKFHPPFCDIYALDMYPLAIKHALELPEPRRVVLMIDEDLRHLRIH
ncbi:hypothetical protein BaRGS_00006934 [Batillaria attramentaria]|uniref:Enoyl-[acyl-carrier-protein] reductase, mitochondrial n=1 Tax=Batillaria attramentaria TaxID=370345 RepID=A0ABD0LQT8_9CAEN